LPKKLIDLYGLEEGAELEFEESREGIFLKPLQNPYRISWEESYKQMAAEQEESLEWEKWDTLVEDGLND